ncbi:MAG: hypothetical protein AB7T59_04020 [Hyphomonadaceae bacterium]
MSLVSSNFWSDEDRGRARRFGIKVDAGEFTTMQARNCEPERPGENGKGGSAQAKALADPVKQRLAARIYPEQDQFEDFEKAVLEPSNVGPDGKLADGPRWCALIAQMKGCFDDHLNPFPYKVEDEDPHAEAPRTQAKKLKTETTSGNYEASEDAPDPDEARSDEPEDPWPRRVLSSIAGFQVPADFFQIHLRMIARRDWSDKCEAEDGVNRDAAGRMIAPKNSDIDVRDLIRVLRYIYGKNLWRLLKIRRWGALTASFLLSLSFVCAVLIGELALVLLWPRMGTGAELQHGLLGQAALAAAAPIGGPVAAILVLSAVLLAAVATVGAWIGEYKKLTKEYQDSINASCANVRSTVVARFSHLRHMTQRMCEEISRKEGYKDEIHADHAEDQWRRAAARWAHLALWTSMRAQHLESFFQLEMWRIRRMEAWLRFIYYVLTAITFAAALVVLLAATVLTVLRIGPEIGLADQAWHALPFAAIAAAPVIYYLWFVNRFIGRKKSTGRRILEDNLGAAIKPGAGDAELPQLMEKTFSFMVDRMRELEKFLGSAVRQARRT